MLRRGCARDRRRWSASTSASSTRACATTRTITWSGEYASSIVRHTFDRTSPIAQYATVPQAFVFIQRINLGLYALLGELRATGNYRRMAEELWPFVGRAARARRWRSWSSRGCTVSPVVDDGLTTGSLLRHAGAELRAAGSVAPMRSPRRLAATALVASVILAACSDSDSATSDSATSDSATTDSATSGTTARSTVASPESSSGKPTVQVPASSPTELQVTDLAVGTGPEAKAGDLLLINYVGVRTADGTEFDNSFDRGSPLNVTLGAGDVIDGWDQGLVGIREGGRRQLDIPPDLAYGDNPPDGSGIEPGDALTFVVDAVSVIAQPDPATIDRRSRSRAGRTSRRCRRSISSPAPVPRSPRARPGSPTSPRTAPTPARSCSRRGTPARSRSCRSREGQTIAGLYEGLRGMHVGGRRQITIPFEAAFGPDGNPALGKGLPPNVDLVLVVELFGTY